MDTGMQDWQASGPPWGGWPRMHAYTHRGFSPSAVASSIILDLCHPPPNVCYVVMRDHMDRYP